MGITQLNFELQSKEESAISLIREYAPMVGEQSYQVCNSFGKDSTVVEHLTVRSGVPFESVHNQTGIDPPELVYFGKANFPNTIWQKPKYSIWTGIEMKGLPRRQSRWCCELLKEYSGKGRRLITGIRAAESSRRKHRAQVELNARGGKKFINPIFNWSESDVWEYIRAHNLPYCELYDISGWNRIGCIMCPMQSWEKSLRDWQRYPKIADAWYRATVRHHERILPKWKEKGSKSYEELPTPNALWWWWLSRGQVSPETVEFRAYKMGLAPLPKLLIPDPKTGFLYDG